MRFKITCFLAKGIIRGYFWWREGIL